MQLQGGFVMAAIEKLAMHQHTTPYWSFKQAVDGYARHELPRHDGQARQA